MKKEKLEEINRMIYLEGKILKLKSKYPEIEQFSLEKKLSFLYDKIELETTEQLTFSDIEYLNRGVLIPFDDIKNELKRYDYSSPKIDEIEFIDALCRKYNIERFMIIRRIKDVRKINKIIDNNQKFDVLAVPYNRVFVIRNDKKD